MRLSLAGSIIAWILLSGSDRAAGAGLPQGFVYLRAVDPTIRQDIRYAGPDNFTGRPLPGYGAAECILRAPAAESLKQVQADLASRGLGLKVFDCYRPRRAVAAMAAWATDRATPGTGGRYFPGIKKSRLHGLGYIARRSAHSTGLAVDVTLVRSQVSPASEPLSGPCTGPQSDRSAADELDMGTGFDCFDPMSHTANPGVGREQAKSRELLVAAMSRRGFANYANEWWHFKFAAAGAASEDFPIAPMSPPGAAAGGD